MYIYVPGLRQRGGGPTGGPSHGMVTPLHGMVSHFTVKSRVARFQGQSFLQLVVVRAFLYYHGAVRCLGCKIRFHLPDGNPDKEGSVDPAPGGCQGISVLPRCCQMAGL